MLRLLALTASTLLMSGALVAGATPATAAPVGCSPEAMMQPSKTYGLINHFAARCDHSLNVTVRARVYRNGNLVRRGSVACKNTNQGQVCDGFVTTKNPRGKQTFKLVVNAFWDLAGQDDRRTRERTVVVWSL